MKKLKMLLTLCVLSISSSLFAIDYVELRIMHPAQGLSDTQLTVIERMDKIYGRWVKCAEYNGFQMNARIDNLIEGHEYRFRVTLVSRFGPGRPSDPTEYILINDTPYLLYVYCRPPELRFFRSANTTVSEKNTTYFSLTGTIKENVTKIPFRVKE